MQRFSKIFRAALLFLFFQIVFVSYRLLPTIEVSAPASFLLPAGELLFILLLLIPGRLQRIRYFICLIFTGTMILYNFGEIFYRFFYMDNFRFLMDVPLIPGMFVMLIPEGLLPPYFIRVLSIIFTAGLLVMLAWIILIPARKYLKKNPIPLKVYTIAAAILLAFGLMFIFPDYSPIIQIVKDFSTSENTIAVSNIEESTDSFESVVEVEVEPEAVWEFPGIKDGDVHIVVVESYGAVLFQRPEYTGVIESVYGRLEPLLRSDGWMIKTGFVRSPAFGGRSWLADSTILAGSQIVNQQMFDERIEDGSPAELLALMGDAGYYRHYVAPGTTNASDQWKTAYPFEHYMIRPDFGYEGPNVAFGTLTDQFAFSVFSKNYLIDDRNDFAFYLLVSSHTPFERIPVFKADWDFSRNGREYEDGYLKFFENNWLYGDELAEGYLEGISYSLETTVRYLIDILTDHEFMLIIGDHQPRKPVSGPDPGYPVLFHIIAPADNNMIFPGSWVLSNGLHPPELPFYHNEIPEMAEITLLIKNLLTRTEEPGAM